MGSQKLAECLPIEQNKVYAYVSFKAFVVRQSKRGVITEFTVSKCNLTKQPTA